MQASVASVLEVVSTSYEIRRHVVRRNGSQHPTVAPDAVYPCRDGFIVLVIIALEEWEALLEWMKETGLATPLYEDRWRDPTTRMQCFRFINEEVARFTRLYSKSELYAEGQRRRLMICPVCTVADLMENPHLRERGFFVEVEHPELDAHLTYLGAPYRFSRTPWQIVRRAPRIGEDNQAIYRDEMGMSPSDLTLLHSIGVI